MDNFKLDNLSITVKKDSDATVFKWEGSSGYRNPEAPIINYFESILNELQGKIVHEFRDLKFINSSTYVPIIIMMKELNEKGIKTHLIYNKNSFWQRVSFRGLEVLAGGLGPSITVEGK